MIDYVSDPYTHMPILVKFGSVGKHNLKPHGLFPVRIDYEFRWH